MQNFIKSGKRGTVLMSLGTNMRSNMLGKDILTSIIKTFAELPDYNFIWKFESEPHDLPVALSKNVFIAKFLPQNDILAQPSVKAFITHSGLLSTHESLWYGKPMIAIPFFADQVRTAAKFVRAGVAVDINFRSLSIETFKKAILNVLEDRKYSENANKISKLFRDKPQRPLDLAVWWIEYVIRNPSAPIYESPSLKLGWIATNSYDIIFAAFIALHVSIFIVYKVIKLIKGFFKMSEGKNLKRKLQ